MVFEGRIYKDGKFWLAEIPILDYLTQGRSHREALEMAKDIVETGIDQTGFKVNIESRTKSSFLIAGNRTKPLIALMLRRLRQKQGLTLREVSRRLGSSSPNAFSSYERGITTPSLEKLEELIRAIDPSQSIVLRIA